MKFRSAKKNPVKKDVSKMDSPAGDLRAGAEGAVEEGVTKNRIKERIFIKYPDRVEPSGKKRIFISESGMDPFFEIFIWEEDDTKTRFDFHYNVHNSELLLTWNRGSEFSHVAVKSENEYNFRTKKTQTVAGEAVFNWSDIRGVLVERLNATCSNRISYREMDYCQITEAIEFILQKIDSRYSMAEPPGAVKNDSARE